MIFHEISSKNPLTPPPHPTPQGLGPGWDPGPAGPGPGRARPGRDRGMGGVGWGGLRDFYIIYIKYLIILISNII